MNRIFSHALTTSCSVLLLGGATHAWGCGQSAATLIDLGMPIDSAWRVNALNAAGRMTGFFVPPGATEAHGFAWDGQVRDLGTLGGQYSHGYVINGPGQIAGESSVTGETATDAFIWSGRGLIDLGTLGGSWSTPTAINVSGQVAGLSLTAGNEAMRAFLYANGSTADLGTLGGDQSFALGLNDSGVVVGGASLAGGDSHGFVFSAGVMKDIGTLGGNYSCAFALNPAGVIVGESTLANGECHGFVYADGLLTDVGTLGGTSSSCIAINSRGQVIGTATTAAGETHGFIYSAGVLTDLGTLGGGFSSPGAINELGQVVGQSVTSNGVVRAFLWQGGGVVDLNCLLPANSGWECSSGTLINDAGRVAGWGTREGLCGVFVLDLAAVNNPPVAVAGADQTVDCGAPVTLDGTHSSDPDGDALVYEWSLGGWVLGTNATFSGSLPLGTNCLTLKVADACGGSARTTTVVRVADTTAPAILSVRAGPAVLSPPNHKPVAVTVSVGVLDNCDADSRSQIVAITANEATEPGDIQITGDLTAVLAASRNPAGGGRVYTITIRSTDASGNSSTSTARVTVPKGNSKNP